MGGWIGGCVRRLGACIECALCGLSADLAERVGWVAAYATGVAHWPLARGKPSARDNRHPNPELKTKLGWPRTGCWLAGWLGRPEQ